MESHQPTQQPLSRILAQTEGPRPGIRVTLAQATPSRLGESSTVATARISSNSRSGDSVSLRRDCTSLKNNASRLGYHSRWNSGVSPCYSRLGEGYPLGRDLQFSHLLAHAFSHSIKHTHPTTNFIHPTTRFKHQRHKSSPVIHEIL